MWFAKVISLLGKGAKFVTSKAKAFGVHKVFLKVGKSVKYITKKIPIVLSATTTKGLKTLKGIKGTAKGKTIISKLSVLDKIFGAMGALSLGLSLKDAFTGDDENLSNSNLNSIIKNLGDDVLEAIILSEEDGDTVTLDLVAQDDGNDVKRQWLPVTIQSVDLEYISFIRKLKVLLELKKVNHVAYAEQFAFIQQLAKLNDAVAIIVEDMLIHSTDGLFLTKEGAALFNTVVTL